jgi:hypothetical protein
MAGCASTHTNARAQAKANLENAVDKAAAMVAVGADDLADPASRSRRSMLSNPNSNARSEISLSRSEMFADRLDQVKFNVLPTCTQI